jgi:hypothetical protein
MNIKILSSAKDDLIDGYNFYEQQQKGIGSYFLDSLFSDIDSLLIYHQIHPVYFDKYYKCLAKRFPFAIYYTSENNNIIVYGVLDCRKNPTWIRNKLDS